MAYYMATWCDNVRAAAGQKAAEQKPLIEAFEERLNGTGRP